MRGGRYQRGNPRSSDRGCLISLIGDCGYRDRHGTPVSVRLLRTTASISGLSIVIAVLVSSLVGVVFGTMPAARAAQLDPVESARRRRSLAHRRHETETTSGRHQIQITDRSIAKTYVLPSVS